MNVWSFLRDGKPTGARFIGPEHALEANTPEGCEAIAGLIPVERVEDPELERSRTIAAIEQLERSQQRPLRELIRDPLSAEARLKLDDIEAKIAELRSRIPR